MNDRSSFVRASFDARPQEGTNNAGTNVSTAGARTKFQPLRVKALLDFCESDDDESEKERVSDSESEADDPVPLAPDLEQNLSDESSRSGAKESGPSQAVYERCGENLSEAVDCKRKSTSVHSQKSEDNVALPSKVEYVGGEPVHMEFTDNLQFNLYSDDRDIGKENRNVNDNKEDKKVYVENERLPLDENTANRIKQETRNQLGELHKPKNFKLEPLTHSSQGSMAALHSTVFDTPRSIVTQDGSNSVVEKNSQAASDLQLPMACNSRRVMDTPMKHISENAVSHPNPCLSQRNIFQTPQNKLQSDYSKCQSRTPAALLHQWPQSSIRQTPLQSKQEYLVDYSRTPITMSYNLQHETPRYSSSSLEKRGVRRPLTDATFPAQHNNDFRVLHESHLSNVDEMKRESSIDQNARKCTENVDYYKDSKKFAYPQTNVTGESREENPHRRIHSMDEVGRNEILDHRILEKRQINFNAYQNVQSGLLQKTEMDTNVSNKPNSNINCNENIIKNQGSETIISTRDRAEGRTETDGSKISRSTSKEAKSQGTVLGSKDAQQEIKQVVDRIANVQFSVPSTSSKLKQNRTIVVKEKEYLILGTLGQGMSGEVLRVQDLTSSELRAIKCVNLSCMDKESAQGCLEEISMLHKLQAPCVIRMFDYEIKYPMVYVVMEMGDTDLSRLLKSMSQEKQLPLTMILYYWTEMLTAVKHIHDNGVIHSDLKPANFLLVRGRLKLIDFGIASSMNGDMTSVVKNCPIGTLNYISPEALMDISGNADSPDCKDNKYKISFKSDVWSLGCILYSLLYGHTPFHHIRSQWAKINAITNPKPNISFPAILPSNENASRVNSPPAILIDVIRKCLQHNPKARPTVAQLLQIQYVPAKPCPTSTSIPNIPPNILVKIKHALSDDEWRHLVQILECGKQS